MAGWDSDPVFAGEWASLVAGLRHHCSSLPWQELLEVEFAVQPWHQLIPGVKPLLDHLGWWVSRDASCICRLDSAGHERRFQLGWDPPAILHEWLCDFHRRVALKKCNRIRRSLHREDPGLQIAGGLDLPGIAWRSTWRHVRLCGAQVSLGLNRLTVAAQRFLSDRLLCLVETSRL